MATEGNIQSAPNLNGFNTKLINFRALNCRIFLVWLALCTILIALSTSGISRGYPVGADDILRLVQIRDFLGGQSWFDLTQYRINPPDGTVMHWPRLVEIPVITIIMTLTPIIGAKWAEITALILIPLLTLGAILWVIGRLAGRFFDIKTAGFACLALGLNAALLFQLQPMRIDHHGWQIFTVAATLAAIAMRNPLKGGLIAGFSMAAGLIISLEVLPMAAGFAMVLTLRWIRCPKDACWLAAYLAALATGLITLFMATQGFGNMLQYCDAIAPAHLGFFAFVALGVLVLTRITKIQGWMLLAALGVITLGGLAVFGAFSPTCLRTPFAALDPLVKQFWYLNILEGQPFWSQPMSVAIPELLQVLVALCACVMLVRQSEGRMRWWWGEYTLLLAFSILAAMLVWRSMGFAGVLAAIPLGWLITRLLGRLNSAKGAVRKLATAGLIVLTLAPSAPVTFGMMISPSSKKAKMVKMAKTAKEKCNIMERAAEIDTLPAATIFAPLDIGPGLLLNSQHQVVATGHHRAHDAMLNVIRAFASSPDEARPIITGHGAEYVALCSGLSEIRMMQLYRPDGLAAQLAGGHTPDWLEPVEISKSESFLIWKVVD